MNVLDVLYHRAKFGGAQTLLATKGVKVQCFLLLSACT